MEKIVTIVGARPQFIKAATLSRALRARGDIVEVMVHTGQHHDEDMSGRFFTDLEMPKPAWNLGIHGGGHGDMTGRMLSAIEAVLINERPDLVLVYGDTNSTLAGALAASKLGIRVDHIEAGLRSFNRRMPEEINRVLVDHLSEKLYCPTKVSVDNLAREGISAGVSHVGDVMYDATLHANEVARMRSTILETLKLRPRGYAVLTIHRAESTNDLTRLAQILEFVREAASGLSIVFPLHPRTRNAIDRAGVSLSELMAIPPIGYFDMHRLLVDAGLVLTDSGGLQKEAYFHRIPCITLRDETEWVETIDAGWNRLWTSTSNSHMRRTDIDDYGDGRAAERIVSLMLG